MASNKRSIPSFLWYAIAIAIIYLVLINTSFWPRLRNIFSSRPLQIEQTPVLLKAIKDIGELTSITVYDEMVVDSSKKAIDETAIIAPLYRGQTEKLVIIARGSLRIGIDMKWIQNSDIVARNDSIFIRLPPAKIIDAIINPTNFEVFIETGTWNAQAMQNLKIKARNKMIQKSIRQGVLVKARQKAEDNVAQLLSITGYKNIYFIQ